MKFLLFVLCLVHFCTSNVFLHFPRGSNNRLDEKSANRQTSNRLFNSGNNPKGGYNVGINNDRKSLNKNNLHVPEFFGSSQDGKGETMMPIVLTLQHGCGENNENVRCNVVLEFACDTKYGTDEEEYGVFNGLEVELRDGTNAQRSHNADNKIESELSVRIAKKHNTKMGF